MDSKKFEELSEELLSLIGGGTLTDYQKNILDLAVPYYRRNYPEEDLESFLTSVLRKSYPQYHLEAYSEEEIAEIKNYIAHYWE